MGVRIGLRAFSSVTPTEAERSEFRFGDDLIAVADVVMDRAFSVPGSPDDVWPWIAQLGKRRAGWYLSRRVERFIPAQRRAITTIDPRWQHLEVGDDVPDYGGRDETLTVARVTPPDTLVYTSQRRATQMSWSITLRPIDDASDASDVSAPSDASDASDATDATSAGRAGARSAQTRVLLRLRLGPIKHVWLAEKVGGLFDLLTIAGMANGLRERLHGER